MPKVHETSTDYVSTDENWFSTEPRLKSYTDYREGVISQIVTTSQQLLFDYSKDLQDIWGYVDKEKLEVFTWDLADDWIADGYLHRSEADKFLEQLELSPEHNLTGKV